MMKEPYELPKGWVWTSLDILTNSLESGGRPKGGVKGIKSGIPSVGGEHLDRNGGFRFKKIRYIPNEYFLKMNKGIIKKKDILIVKDGATTGKTSFVNKNFPFEKAAINEHVFILRTFSGFIDEKYLFRYLFSFGGQKQIFKKFQGSAQGGINTKFINDFFVPLPPFHEQQRIIKRLESLIDQINISINHLIKVPHIIIRLRQSILATACSGLLTEDWRKEHTNIESSKELLIRIKRARINSYERACKIAKQNNKRKPKKFYDIKINPVNHINNNIIIPNTWLKCYINDIGDVFNGSTPSRKEKKYWNGDISWISSGEVTNNIINSTKEKITEIGFNNSSLRMIPKGTVLLAMIGEGKTRGQSSILNIKATINQNIAAIILEHNLIVPKYLWYWFQYQYELTRTIGSGSGPKALNCQRVREIPFILIPLKEQMEIVRYIEIFNKIVNSIEQHYSFGNSHVKKIIQSLLIKAFLGKLVPQDLNDEPASVLLENIKEEREKRKKEKKGKKKIKTLVDFK